MNDILYKKILAEINEIKIIDTHEHIMSLTEVHKEQQNVFKIFENSYANLDLISSGMPPGTFNQKNLDDIWQIFKKYQEKTSMTTFFRNIIRALKDLYDLDDDMLSGNTYQVLSKKIEEAYQKQDWYRYVLKEKSKIKVSLLDSFWNVESFQFDKSLFLPVLRTNPFILGREYISSFTKGKRSHSTIEDISEAWCFNIDHFESYLDLISTAIRKYKNNGCPAVKIGTAYERSLYFEKIPINLAKSIYKKNPHKIDSKERKMLQDFMAHYIIQKATEENMPVQIHTGTFARNSSIISNGNPEQLNNLFLEYPDTRFVLFHFSYPYTSQLFSLAKIFPNVMLDFCWVPMLSINMAKKYLNEFFDLIPYNKLMWGGDSYTVEEAYGATCLAREIIAWVLTERVKNKEINSEKALQIAYAILNQNASNFYGLI